ncbi:MAG TPA: hypothetical protein VG500_03080 [Gemmatimonadales bacterium]|jgi:hypothetical protein|nr:hypothetical protein [Gemmatimonadales bacterium]
MRALWWIPMLVLTLAGGQAAAQSAGAGRTGPRVLLPREREIALARTAAPPAVSRDATVMVLTERGFEVAVKGTSGVTCVVNRSHPESLEPHCFDPEGSATVLPMELRRTELLREGKGAEEIDREIAAGLKQGRYRLPRRPAMSYMMSPEQVLFSDEGKRVGKWQPHLMIYYPHLSSADLGLAGPPSTEAALVVDEGKPVSNIMIVVKEFAGTAAAESESE